MIAKRLLRALKSLFSTRCPHCGSIEYRSVGVRNVLEQAFLWLMQPCRCDFCGRHYFLFRWQLPISGPA